MSLDRAEELLSLWKSLGRPHPVILRGDILAGRHSEICHEAVDLLNWSWRVWKCAKDAEGQQ